MRRPPRDHWYLRILQPVLALIKFGYQTLEVHLVKKASTRDTISKIIYGTNVELMEFRRPKVNGTVKERYFIRIYFSKTRPLEKVLHQYRLVQVWNGRCLCKQMFQRKQENHRHNKSPAESVNLKSP